MSMSGAIFPQVGRGHMLFMGGPKLRQIIGRTAWDPSRCSYRVLSTPRSVRINNQGQSEQRSLLTATKRLPRYVPLSFTEIFSDILLMEALERHGGRWEGTEIDSSNVAPEITRLVMMENQPKVHDRVDALYEKLQKTFPRRAWVIQERAFVNDFERTGGGRTTTVA